LESALEAAVREHNVQNRATGILMDVNTGQIIAMATKGQGGSFDPNEPFILVDEGTLDALSIMTNEEERAKTIYEAQIRQWANKAITDLYEPGSVFKVITASTALETHAATMSDSYYCGRSFKVTDEVTMYCALTAHGQETFPECLINSCNPGFIQIGQQIGRTRFYSYFKNFGFTSPTGIDLPGEANSIYYTADRMNIVELASSSYGQSNSITPIQMITAFSAVVNGGYLVSPHVVEQIIDSEGNVVESFGNPVKRQVISEETSAQMRSILEQIINPKNSAYVSGYRIGGKSGTAEKLSEQADAPDGQRTFIASFCVFAPADNPRYALLVMLDEARSYTIYGTTLVGPVCAKIMSDVLPYLGLEPTYTEEELRRTDVGVPNLSGSLVSVAYSELQKRGLSYELVGEGTNVTLTTPQAGFAVSRGSVVYLYTEANPIELFVSVPSVKGESIENATEIFKKAGLNIRVGGVIEGWVVANTQSIPEGEEVAAGSVVSVDFIGYTSTD
ncbi:MAG: penicillin-binding transpeptidase domain-containing protein, partial [Oscillospiraceae bacterium]|nr:penicillin-binding transpeptidase domain-containing protein [Oscillospiraceae bacterium]